MKRTELLDSLKRAEPALGSRDMVTVLRCFRFDGNTVIAYNDTVAISIPCELDLKGGINGAILLGWLEASRALDVTVQGEDDDAQVVAAGSVLNTPLIDDDDFIFDFPADEDAIGSIELNPRAIGAFNRVANSMGQDMTATWRIGITVCLEKKKITVYASDNVTASRETIEVDVPRALAGTSFIMPPRFVELFLSNAMKDSVFDVLIGEGWINARFESEMMLWSRRLDEAQPDQFEAIFERLADRNGAVPVPRGFDDCLNRLSVPLNFSDYRAVEATVKKGNLKMFSDSPMGTVRETLKVRGHDDVKVRFDPSLVRRVLDHSVKMAFKKDKCVHLQGSGSFDCVVALTSDE